MGLDTLGLSSMDYAGHSFWIDAATTAAERGIEDSLIKMLFNISLLLLLGVAHVRDILGRI